MKPWPISKRNKVWDRENKKKKNTLEKKRKKIIEVKKTYIKSKEHDVKASEQTWPDGPRLTRVNTQNMI
jgi:hypothetical protein